MPTTTTHLPIRRLFGILSMLALAGCTPSTQSWNGTLVDPPMEIVDFELVSSAGKVTKAAWAGKYVALVFGYTHCPDFCPTTMARMAEVVDLLDEQVAEDLRVVLITVDPQRDTADILTDYARSFNSNFTGLTGSEEQLTVLMESIGIYSEPTHGEHHPGDSQGYLVNHTTHVILLDPAGRMRLIWAYDLSPEAMVEDLKRLL